MHTKHTLVIRSFRSKLLILVTLGAPVILGITIGCNSKPATLPRSFGMDAIAELSLEFVGSEACAECHPKQNETHGKTGHAQTLRVMSAMGDQLPAMGVIPNTQLSLDKVDEQLAVTSKITGKYIPLEYAIGSGKQGITFTSVLAPTTLFEMHYSYFPETKKWYVTPGHEQNRIDPKSQGMSLGVEPARKCLLCHAVSLPVSDLHPSPNLMGVGCESCHGAGNRHIAAAKTKGVTNFLMEKLATIGGKKMNELCGKCHRQSDEVAKMPENNRLSQRFFPYGISISKCFQKSDDKLSCSTCHDPHTDISRDIKVYEAKCLTCHSSGTSKLNPERKGSAISPVVCKVNPNSGCIDCHMPRKVAFPGTQLPNKMADHFIRIYGKK